jgi:hypothetical protein
MPNPIVTAVNNPAGKDAYVYMNTATAGGSYHSAPTWTARDNIMDVDIEDTVAMHEVKLRKNNPMITNVPTLRKLMIKFKIALIRTDPFYTDLLYAYQNGQGLDMLFLDGVVLPATGVTTRGLRADWGVATFKENQHLENGMEVDVELVPLQTGNVPADFSVTGA